MKKHNLSTTGLSMSQAASISNLCYQSAQEIANQLGKCNNYSKTFGTNTLVKGNPLPNNVMELLKKKAAYNACQAFLMENIKAKEALLDSKKRERYLPTTDAPELPEYDKPNLLSSVDEDWGWEQLSGAEIAEYLQVEAFAAHIGQFIHDRGKLDTLRKELNSLPDLDFIELKQGEKTPVNIDKHHTSDELLALHNKLASEHRQYEQKVNYFKAKVKNLVTEQNAQIQQANADEQARVNANNLDLREDYNKAVKAYNDANAKAEFEFNAQREKAIKEIAQLRISIDSRFQPVIDEFIVKDKE